MRLDRTAIRAIDNEFRGMACVSEIGMILAILKCIGRVLVLGANCVVGIALVVVLATGRDHTRVRCVLLMMRLFKIVTAIPERVAPRQQSMESRTPCSEASTLANALMQAIKTMQPSRSHNATLLYV